VARFKSKQSEKYLRVIAQEEQFWWLSEKDLPVGEKEYPREQEGEG